MAEPMKIRATLQGDGSFALDRGFVEIARHAALDGLQSFTIEATVAPTVIVPPVGVNVSVAKSIPDKAPVN